MWYHEGRIGATYRIEWQRVQTRDV